MNVQVKEISVKFLMLQDKITDQGLFYLSKCTALTDVDLDFCTLFTDEGLKHVKNLHNLRSFCVDSCKNFTDQGLKYLSEVISFWSTKVKLEGMSFINEFETK